MCLTTDSTTYTQKPKNSIQNRGVAQLGARDIWEHRQCSHRLSVATAESPLTVRFLDGMENKKWRSKMCLTTDLTTYMTTI